MEFNIESTGMASGASGFKLGDQIIELKAVTWCKDSHGLFDYESKALEIKKFYVEQSSAIHREGEEILITPFLKSKEPATAVPQRKKLLTITTDKTTGKDEKYFIDPNSLQVEESKNNDVYLIVRSLKNQEGMQRGFSLTPGNVIKLGRMELKILECGYRNGKVAKIDSDLDQEREFRLGPKASEAPTSGEEQKPVCRICLNDDDFESVLIAPCRCRGSCEYMHLACFQHWFKSKIQEKEYNNAVNFHWKKIECEVCQEPLPRLFRIQGERHELFDLKRPKDIPYLIVETVVKEKKAGRGIHVLKVTEEGVKLGRGHQCDVRIGDISVSRLHAEIKYQNDSFLLTDNNSKFGTLVHLPDIYPICEEKVAVQVGRTVITFVLKPKIQILKQKSTKLPMNGVVAEKKSVRSLSGLHRANSEAFHPGNQLQMIDLESMSPSRGMIIETENMRNNSEPLRREERLNNAGNLMEEESNVVGLNVAPANCPLPFPNLPNIFRPAQQVGDAQAAQYYNHISQLVINNQNQAPFTGISNTYFQPGYGGPSNKGPFN